LTVIPSEARDQHFAEKYQEMQIPRRLRRLGMTTIGVLQQAARAESEKWKGEKRGRLSAARRAAAPRLFAVFSFS